MRLGVKVAQAASRWVRPPATQLYLRLNAAALAASLIVAPASYVWSRQPKNMVASLVGPHMPFVVSDVIAAGAPAVPYLRDDLEQSIRDDGFVRTYRVSQACYALARIGGAEAEQILQHIVAERIPIAEVNLGRWQMVACCSFAECARSRAAPDLKRLFERSTGDDQKPIRFAALCALARTCDREGVLFVLDHREEFWDNSPDDHWSRGTGDVGARIAQYLVVHRDPELLTFGPLYDTAAYVFGLPQETTRSAATPAQAALRIQTIPEPVEDLAEIEHQWEENEKQIRDEWEALLGTP